ncbi:hypothetical protein M405DRAFT_828817 [Rhizopogon salebrosus TDB-379]|nr:hypothetical protein M405DRAFT_828817 [Rhizopogon salebrosus TDB-379]
MFLKVMFGQASTTNLGGKMISKQRGHAMCTVVIQSTFEPYRPPQAMSTMTCIP